jgi:ABC-type microcin C transport system permease subunit YejB
VWQLIKEKLPVSLSLGLWTFLISYLLSIPLGIAKAMREGSRFDTLTTMVVLVGYAIPGFVLGVVLIVVFAGGTFLDWFPLRGLVSDNWAELSWPARISDYLWHLTLPLICFAIGSLAVLTMLTKNTFVEEIRKQYVLVARAKGLSDRRVLYKHVFRNALIPLVTGFPAAFIGAVLRRVAADRDAVLARRAGLAVVRISDPARLSGGAGHAVLLHADRAGGEADRRSAVCGGRQARAVRRGGEVSGRQADER